MRKSTILAMIEKSKYWSIATEKLNNFIALNEKLGNKISDECRIELQKTRMMYVLKNDKNIREAFSDLIFQKIKA